MKSEKNQLNKVEVVKAQNKMMGNHLRNKTYYLGAVLSGNLNKCIMPDVFGYTKFD